MSDHFVAPFEVKFATGTETGEFEGYAAVFGNQDWHGDVIKPGAFADSLAERKAAGRSIPMHLMHGFLGGDGLPVGVWKDVAEDSKGLYVKGKISGATTTDTGRLLFERVKDGALPGMSIGYKVKPNGATYGRAAGEPKRTIKAVHLKEISLVSDPSNPLALVSSVKAAVGESDTGKAVAALASAMRLHDQSMGDGYSYGTPRDKAKLMNHLRDAHEALTGSRAPDGLDSWKAAISRAEYIDGVKSTFNLTDDQAAAMADLVLKSPSGDPDAPDVKAAAADLSFLSDFRLPPL